MLALQEIIEKLLLFRDSSFSTSFSNPNIFSKALLLANFQSKATNRWNQSDLGYFNLYLDTKVYGKGKIVLVEKNIYYKNIVLFVQRIQNLVTFKGIALVKANISTLLRRSTFEWYTSKLAEFDQNILNNNLGMKSWINMLSQRFKVPTSVAPSLLTNKTYSLNNTQCCQPLAQYI